MKYSILLNKSTVLGQIPVLYKEEIEFFICGNLDNFNHTIILTDKFHHEIGRLYLDSSHFLSSYSIDVINHPLVKINKLNSSFTNLFYITKLKYWVKGSIKKGNYSFYKGTTELANVRTLITNDGNTLSCNIQNTATVPFILLSAMLFTQWHVTPLRLPYFSLFSEKNMLFSRN